MDRAVDIDVALVNTTGINRDGTPRQDILAECDERTLLFVGEDTQNGGVLGILVRRKQFSDAERYFNWVGEFPSEYRHLWEAGWTFKRSGHEVIKSL